MTTKPIPAEVLAAARQIADISDTFWDEQILESLDWCEWIVNSAIKRLTNQRIPRTHSRWLRLHAAAEVMRRHFGGGDG